MKYALSVALIVSLAATASAAAQDRRLTAPQSRFSQEAIRQAASAVTLDAARPGRVDSRSAAGGSEPNRSWDALAGNARTGRKVIVSLMNSATVEGRLLGIDARSISVEQPGGPRVIDAADVARVRYAGVRKRHVVYGMLIGAAVGGLATAIIDRQSSHPSSTGEAVGMGAVFIGLPAGAIAGAVVPAGAPLYEAAPVARRRP